MQHVIITGASSGIGAETARLFSKNEYHVILVGRSRQRLQKVASELKSENSVFTCDLNDSSQSDQLAEFVRSKITSQPLHCLVNNAGIFDYKSLDDSDDELWTSHFQTNLLAHVRLTRSLAPVFREQKMGSIVNVSSSLSFRPTAGTVAYSAMKAALNTWTQGLAIEMAPYQVRANCICPGIVDTPIHSFHSRSDAEGQRLRAQYGRMQPLGRIGQPEEISEAIYFLASKRSSWTTGTIINVDGGISLNS